MREESETMAANVSVGQEAQMCVNACAADQGMAAKDNSRDSFSLLYIHSFQLVAYTSDVII